MTLDTWLEKLEAPYHNHIDLGLARIKEVAARLNMPTTFSANVITVAGTNGKGSSVACLESIYHHAGYQVASYTSPHLLHFNERIKINRQPIDNYKIVKAFEAIDYARQNTHLTYFEFSTLAAFLIFHQRSLDVIIIEMGIGGRLDCCNIIDSDISLITSIDLDHTEYLGEDRESIGREKAGIMRAGKPVVCADINPPYSISKCAKELNAELYCVKAPLQTQSSIHSNIHPNNLAGVKKVVELMQKQLPVSEEQRQFATASLKVPARQEVMHHHCEWIFDVSHNPASIKYLSESLSTNETSAKTIAIFHMLNDKRIEKSISHIAQHIDEWHLIPIDSPRASKTEKLLQSIEAISYNPCYNHSSVSSAVDQVLIHAKSSDRVVVFGSFLTVAAVRPLVTSRCNFRRM